MNPPCPNSPDYWVWAKSILLSDDPREFAFLLGPRAEFRRVFGEAFEEALRCGYGREECCNTARDIAYEYCFDVAQARHAYEGHEPVQNFLSRLLQRAIDRRLPPDQRPPRADS
jgi:hypothetical protein